MVATSPTRLRTYWPGAPPRAPPLPAARFPAKSVPGPASGALGEPPCPHSARGHVAPGSNQCVSQLSKPLGSFFLNQYERTLVAAFVEKWPVRQRWRQRLRRRFLRLVFAGPEHVRHFPLVAGALHHKLAGLAFAVEREVQDRLVGRLHLLFHSVKANSGAQAL